VDIEHPSRELIHIHFRSILSEFVDKTETLVGVRASCVSNSEKSHISKQDPGKNPHNIDIKYTSETSSKY
jgi:hypothetical protein